ncbi:MAG: MmcQ/YjbR family DNA-binding protein [Dehalococcoidia bacterium]
MTAAEPLRRTPNEQQPHVHVPAVDRVRKLCLSLPGSSEKEAWGDPSFRANGRMYAIMKFGRGMRLWCAAPAGAQQVLVESDPARFFKPSNHPLHSGWIGITLDLTPIDWDAVGFLLAQAHEVVVARGLRPSRKE